MQGDRIRELNAGLETFRSAVMTDAVASRRVDIAIVTFDSEVRVVQDFVTMIDFHPPALTASGQTHLAGGIERALDLIDSRKETYRKWGISYYRPWVFMITDGKSEGESDEAVAQAAHRVHLYEKAKHVAFFAVGIEGADIRQLTHIVVRTPLELEGLQFRQMFQWLSGSIQTASTSQPGERVVLAQPGWIKRIALYVTEHEEELTKVAGAVGKVGGALLKGAVGWPPH
jgi:uncharacterized protein YegL